MIDLLPAAGSGSVSRSYSPCRAAVILQHLISNSTRRLRFSNYDCNERTTRPTRTEFCPLPDSMLHSIAPTRHLLRRAVPHQGRPESNLESDFQWDQKQSAGFGFSTLCTRGAQTWGSVCCSTQDAVKSTSGPANTCAHELEFIAQNNRRIKSKTQ